LKNNKPRHISKGWQFLPLLFVITLAVTIAAQAVVSKSTPAAASDAWNHAASEEVFRQLLYLPAPTPHTQESGAEEVAQNKRPPGFYAEDKAPPDDAPLEDLLDYWERWANASGRDKRKPSDAVRERLLAACENEPERLPILLPVLPETADAADRVKKLYDAAQGYARFDEEWRKIVKEWLQFNSKYFIGDLLGMVRKAKDKNGYVDKEEALKALAKVDWESAAPLLQSMSGGSQPRTAAVALALLYRHAIEEKDLSGEEKYRALLQAIAADRSAPPRARDNAIRELSLSEWAGRDNWYLSLLADETLLEATDGNYLFSPLTTLFDRDPDKWIPVMTKLVESKDPALRQNAASCLVQYATEHPRRDAILPVLRWLSDPDWLDINGTQRAWFMQKMDELDMPESVPGLIWIVENDEWNRHWAARTLAHYKDPRAIPALKKALAEEKDEDHRQYFIQSLLAADGITVVEQLAALEAYLAKLTTAEGREAVNRYPPYGDDTLPLPVSIGKYLSQQQKVTDALVRAVLSRAEDLERKNPAAARALLGLAQGWQAKQVDLDLVRRIGEGTADAAMIASALQRRIKLRESVGPELQSLISARGTAPGVAAVLLADDGVAQSILGTGDEQTQIALLACARLVQMPLPVSQVGVLLNSKSLTLSLAAERYLLAEDSREARQLLWEHHPQQAFITGWRENIQLIGGNDFSAMDRGEEKLRAELFRPEDAPLETFALLGNDEQPLQILRVYAKRAIYTHYEDASRYRERVITREELVSFKNFVTTNNLLELGPQFGPCHHDCWVSEFLSLTRQGGRRVFSHQGLGGWITLIANFNLLGRDGVKIHYRLEDEIKGLEVLLADETLFVKDVWQRGDDLRVLVEREATLEEIKQGQSETVADAEEEDDEAAARAQRRHLELERAKARVSWRAFTGAKLGAVTSPPEGYATLDKAALDIDNDFPSHLNAHLAQATAGDYIVLAADLGKGGLWKKAAGQKAVRISGEGVYANPLVTPDGKWAVAARADTDWRKPNDVIRFNLKTGREYRVDVPPATQFEPVAYLSAQGKVLLRRARDENDDREAAGPASPEFYLLDASTGQTQLVRGVFEPLLQEGNRFLQPTSRQDEFWAAVPDSQTNQTRVGRYSLRDFSFQTLLVVPHLKFDSTLMWVDEAGAKLYIIYEGQLLRLPLPGSPKDQSE
jgi:hypothetical protein